MSARLRTVSESSPALASVPSIEIARAPAAVRSEGALAGPASGGAQRREEPFRVRVIDKDQKLVPSRAGDLVAVPAAQQKAPLASSSCNPWLQLVELPSV